MSTLLKCNFVLSKKLQKIVEQGEPVYLQINAVHGNRGSGWIRVWTNSDSELDLEAIGETSIMLTPSEVLEDIPDLGNAIPAQSLFQGTGIEQQPASSPVSKLAYTDPDRKLDAYSSPWAEKTRKDGERTLCQPEPELDLGEEAQSAVKPLSRSAAVKEQASGLQPPDLAEMPSQKTAQAVQEQQGPPTINSYDQLMEEITSLGDIDSYKPKKASANGRVGREAALDMEDKGKLAPRVKKPIYVANLRGGMIEIADMEFTISDKEVVDFSQIEAQKLRDSRDFKWCLDNGILGFSDRGEFMYFLENRDSMLDANDRGLKAYSGAPGEAADKAADAMYEGFDNPIVDEEVVSGGSHQRIRQAAQARSRTAAGHVSISDNDDILDLDAPEPYDQDARDMNDLMGSMESGGVPQGQPNSGGLPPINRSSRAIPGRSSRRSSGPKSIRKV